MRGASAFSRRPGHPSSRGRFPFGSGLPVITVSQRFVVDSVMAFAGGFNVLAIPGVVAWFDLLDPTAYTESGGNVTALRNKVSGVSWAAVSSCPFEATGLNGHPCLHPSTIAHYFLSTEAAVVNALNCASSAKPYTIWIVEVPDTATGGGVVVGVGSSTLTASTNTRVWGRRVGVSQYEYNQTAPATVVTAPRSVGPVNTGLNVQCWHSPGVGVKLSLNNAADDPNNTTLAPTGGNPDRVAIGGCRPDLSPDSPNTGSRLGEIVIASAEADAALRAQFNTYATARWS